MSLYHLPVTVVALEFAGDVKTKTLTGIVHTSNPYRIFLLYIPCF